MVDLVAEGACQKAAAADLKLLTLAVVGAHGNVHGAFGDTPTTRQRETALLLLLFACKSDDAGVDEFIYFPLFHLNNGDTAKHSYLRCGKTDTVGGVHRFQHIIKKRDDARSDFINGTADLAKCLVTVFYNFEFCNNSFPHFRDLTD